MNIQRYKRGQIWWMRDNSPIYNEHVQGGTRPIIIISNDLANRFSNNLTVIPCTSAEKKDMPTHIKFEINGPSTALCEMITTVPNKNLMNYVGTCDEELLRKIEECVIKAIGLEHYTNIPSPTNPVPIEKQEGFIRVGDKLITNLVIPGTPVQEKYTTPTPYEPYPLKPEKQKFSAILPKDIQDTKKESKPRKYANRMNKEEKQRFLNDYENHDKAYMLKKYKIKDDRCLHQKVYMIRKEFGLGVRNK